jgi:hypothetical protein
MSGDGESQATTSGTGVFFDGKTGARHPVAVTLGAASLTVEVASGRVLAEWPYDEIDELPAPASMLRLGRRGNAVLERLDIRDLPFAHAIDLRARHVDRTGALQRRQRVSVIGWTLAATASLVLVALFGVPAIAERLAPLLPPTFERRLGDAVDIQVRGMLDTRDAGAAFECGNVGGERAGRAALDKIVKRLEAAADLRLPLRTTVVRRPEANAMALPGGQIYVFQGLIAKADNADEVAGGGGGPRGAGGGVFKKQAPPPNECGC